MRPMPVRSMLLLLGLLPTMANADNSRRAELIGPNFVVDYIASAQCTTGTDGSIRLDEGSTWIVPSKAENHESTCAIVNLQAKRGLPVFLSCDAASRVVNAAAFAQLLAANRVWPSSGSETFGVSFHGPPAVYQLNPRRPGFSRAKQLIEDSIASGSSFDKPDLVVTIDVVTDEIIDVRPITSLRRR